MSRTSVQFVTSTGYYTTIQWTGVMAPGQIYYANANCSGAAYLNSASTNVSYIYGKTLVNAGSPGVLMAPSAGSIQADGTAVSSTAATLGLDNPTCGAQSSGATTVWPLSTVSRAAAGLPDTIATPLRLQ